MYEEQRGSSLAFPAAAILSAPIKEVVKMMVGELERWGVPKEMPAYSSLPMSAKSAPLMVPSARRV